MILPTKSRRHPTDEILSVRHAGEAWGDLEELEERLESAMLLHVEGQVLQPCVWACECFSIRLS